VAGGRDDRQDRDVDPGGVHRLDAALADVLEPGLVVAHGVEGDAFVSRPALQAAERVAILTLFQSPIARRREP
jgi:hypothetical protein